MRAYFYLDKEVLIQSDPDSRAIVLEKPRGITGSEWESRMTINLPYDKRRARAQVRRLIKSLERAHKRLST